MIFAKGFISHIPELPFPTFFLSPAQTHHFSLPSDPILLLTIICNKEALNDVNSTRFSSTLLPFQTQWHFGQILGLLDEKFCVVVM
jgi:hypothetical protein